MIRKYYSGWDGGSAGGDTQEKDKTVRPMEEIAGDAIEELRRAVELAKYFKEQSEKNFNAGIDAAIRTVESMAVIDVNNASFYKKFSQYFHPYQTIIDSLSELKKQTT